MPLHLNLHLLHSLEKQEAEIQREEQEQKQEQEQGKCQMKFCIGCK